MMFLLMCSHFLWESVFPGAIIACVLALYLQPVFDLFKNVMFISPMENVFMFFVWFMKKFSTSTMWIRKLSFSSFRRKKKLDPKKIFDTKFASKDSVYQKKHKLTDLRTTKNDNSNKCNYVVEAKIYGLDKVVRMEIDSDSHLSLLSEKFFLKHKHEYEWEFSDEEPPRYHGMGGAIRSKYPPLILELQLGGTLISGRFVITSELKNVEILLGTDCFNKYAMSLVAQKTGGYKLNIGTEPLGSVPCILVRKIMSSVNKIRKVSDDEKGFLLKPEEELDELLEPGLQVPVLKDRDKELEFIQKHPNIPERHKETLVNCLKRIPNLYAAGEFANTHVPPEVFTHDVELLDPNIKELKAKPFPVTGIRLAQLKADIDEMVKLGLLMPTDSEFLSPIFYVLKKAGANKTAQRGRLCFNFRKLNSLIKPLN